MKKIMVLITALLFTAGMIYIEDAQASPSQGLHGSKIVITSLHKHTLSKKHQHKSGRNSGITADIIAETTNVTPKIKISSGKAQVISAVPFNAGRMNSSCAYLPKGLLADSSAVFKEKADITILTTRN